MKASIRDYAHLHFLILILGFTAILGLLIEVPPLEMVFYRTFLAAIILGAIFYRTVKSGFKEKASILKMLGTGAIISIHWILFFGSARVSNASVCLAGMATTALWTSILEPLILKRKVSIAEVFFGTLVIFGLYIIFRFEFQHALGLSLAVLSAMFAAIFSILNAVFIRTNNPYTITFLEMVGASLASLIFVFLFYQFIPDSGNADWSLTGMDVFYLFLLSGVCTVYAFSASVDLMRKITPFTLNLSLNMEPVYGIILAVIIFGEKEKMSPGFYLGTSIILFNVIAYPIYRRWRKQRAIQ